MSGIVKEETFVNICKLHAVNKYLVIGGKKTVLSLVNTQPNKCGVNADKIPNSVCGILKMKRAADIVSSTRIYFLVLTWGSDIRD